MKLFNANKLLLWVSAFFLLTLSACDKDKEEGSGLVELLSFGPSGIQHGEDIRFIGNNLHKVTAIQFVGATVEKGGFKEQTTEIIVLTLPDAVEAGQVKLITTDGEIVSKATLNLEIGLQVNGFTSPVKPGTHLTINGKYLNWVTEILFNKDVVVTEFVSQTVDQLVVQVPMEAQTGELVFTYSGTEPGSLETDEVLEVILPAFSGFEPVPAERGKEFTITGTDLDLVKGVLFKGLSEPITEFVSKSETSITLVIPESANRGTVSLMAYSDVVVESEDGVSFVGDLEPLPPLSYAFYIDALLNNWQNWGWSTTIDFNNKDNVRDGESAMKISYTGQWGALRFANTSVNMDSYNELSFALYGTPGTDGKKINIFPDAGSTVTITIEEGKWMEFKITKAELGNPAAINQLTFQNHDWTGVVYLDHVGLR